MGIGTIGDGGSAGDRLGACPAHPALPPAASVTGAEHEERSAQSGIKPGRLGVGT
jgi:hypothetical protein